MESTAGSTKLDLAMLKHWIKFYHLEDYLFDEVRQRFVERHTLDSRDFFAIVIWKSNRSKTKVKAGLSEAGKSVEELMREVSREPKPAEKVKALLDIKGIGIPIASAILAVCYPKNFTVLDYRAWESLQNLPIDKHPCSNPYDTLGYLEYCEACKDLADQFGMSLRELDHALWGKSWEEDLNELVGEQPSRSS